MEEDIKRDIVNYRRQKACDLMHDVDVLIDNEPVSYTHLTLPTIA